MVRFRSFRAGLVAALLGTGLLDAPSPPDPAALAAFVEKADLAPTPMPASAAAIVARLIVGRHIDDTLAAELRDQTTVDVNLAARLQTLTRDPQLAADILCSEATRQAAAAPGPLRDAGDCTVKGRAAPVRVWAVEPDASSTS